MAKYLDPNEEILTISIPKNALADANVAKAVSLVEESAYTDAELYAIDKYWDSVSRERTALDEKFEKGEAKGLAKGRAEGEARGRKKEKIAIAKNMKSLKLDIDVIVNSTGLTISEIEEL